MFFYLLCLETQDQLLFYFDIRMSRRNIVNTHSPRGTDSLIYNQGPINQSLFKQEAGRPSKSAKFKRFKIPPDLQMCYVHQQATAFGRDREGGSQECPCCHQVLKERLIYSQASDKNISRINYPVGFYFSFIKLMLFGLLIVIVFPGIYTIVQILEGEGCSLNQQGQLKCNEIYGIPFPEFRIFYTWVSLGLNAAIMVVMYVLIAFLYYWNVLTHQQTLYTNSRASEYHSFLTGINHAKVTRELLVSTLRDYNIVQVVYTYKIKEIINLMVQKDKLQARSFKYQREGRQDKANKLKAKIKVLDDKLMPIKDKFQQGMQWQMRTDKLFIKFKTKADKYKFEQQYNKGMLRNIYGTICKEFSGLTINNCRIYVQILGDPRQIVWQNLQVSSKRRYITILVHNLITIILLGLSFYFIVQLTHGKQQFQALKESMLAIAFSIIVQIINFGLGMFIDFTIQLQGRYTLTGQTQAKIIKQAIVYFLNTTLLPFSLLIIESDGKKSNEDVMKNILTLFFTCNIISPIISQYCQIAYLLKVLNRYRIKRAGKECLQTQIRGNEIFQKIDFNLQNRYGSLFQRLANCFFYAGIFPLGAVITALGLIITYFIAKKQLISLCSIPKHSFRLGILITNMAASLPFIYCLGTVLNLYTYDNDQAKNSSFSILLVGISALISLVFLLKGHDLAKKFVKPQDIQASKIDTRVQVQYKDLNPATCLLGTQDEGTSKLPPTVLVSMMKFSALKDAIGIHRDYNRNSFRSEIKELFQDYEQQQ